MGLGYLFAKIDKHLYIVIESSKESMTSQLKTRSDNNLKRVQTSQRLLTR